MKKNLSRKTNEISEIKYNFLLNAISDISSNIQLIDTKISIIIGAVVAILVGISACYEPIESILKRIMFFKCKSILLIIFTLIGLISSITIFIFGIMTVNVHFCDIKCKSKWYIRESRDDYPFIKYMKDVKQMKDIDIMENMIAELYKLNDINRDKIFTYKVSLFAFLTFLLCLIIISILFFTCMKWGV